MTKKEFQNYQVIALYAGLFSCHKFRSVKVEVGGRIARCAGLFSLTPTPSEPPEETKVIALYAGLFSHHINPTPVEPKVIARYAGLFSCQSYPHLCGRS